MTPALWFIAAVAFVFWTVYWTLAGAHAAARLGNRTAEQYRENAKVCLVVGIVLVSLLTLVCWLAGGFR